MQVLLNINLRVLAKFEKNFLDLSFEKNFYNSNQNAKNCELNE